MKTLLLAILAAVLVAACALPGTGRNLALKWSYYPCVDSRFLDDPPVRPDPMYVVDTSAGTLLYQPLGARQSFKISFRFLDAEEQAILQKADDIGFARYPSVFRIAEDNVRWLAMPAEGYVLGVTNDGASNSVTWVDDAMVKSPYGPADRLRELMDLIKKAVESHPEVQELPPNTASCL